MSVQRECVYVCLGVCEEGVDQVLKGWSGSAAAALQGG